MRHKHLMHYLAAVNAEAMIRLGYLEPVFISDLKIDAHQAYQATGPQTFVVAYRSRPDYHKGVTRHEVQLFFVIPTSVGLDHAALMAEVDKMEELSQIVYAILMEEHQNKVQATLLAQEPVYNVTAALVSGFSVKYEFITLTCIDPAHATDRVFDYTFDWSYE